MSYELDGAAHARLGNYLSKIGAHLRDKRKRASFAMYAHGLLSDGERKSVEPIAARASGDPQLVRAYTERLLHFVGMRSGTTTLFVRSRRSTRSRPWRRRSR
jgi:SRSO17 transposase